MSTHSKLRRQDMPYRPCAGIMLFNKQGKVWVGQRLTDRPEPDAKLWQMPQGGIDKGEEALDAAKRELFEETNVRTARLLEPAPQPLYYDLPDESLGIALRGKYRGQKQDWFAFLLEGADDEIDIISPASGLFKPEFSDWRWEKLAHLPDLIVPFKRDAYLQLVLWFAHLPDQICRDAK